VNERSKNSHNTSGGQEVNPSDAAPDPAAESQKDQSVSQGGETDFGTQSEKLISDTVGRLAVNLRK